jgi:hypothetical protein
MVDCIGLSSGNVRTMLASSEHQGRYPGAANLDAASAGSEANLSHWMGRPGFDCVPFSSAARPIR